VTAEAGGPQPVPARVLRITPWIGDAPYVQLQATWIAGGDCSDQLVRMALRGYDTGLRYLAGQKNLPRVLHRAHNQHEPCNEKCLLLEAVEPGADQGEYRAWFGEEVSH
jgi:hypothetical protein